MRKTIPDKRNSALSSGVFTLVLLLTQAPAHAEDIISFSGFMSIVGGQVLNGSNNTPLNDNECPCFISDWNHLATYGKNFGVAQESRAGVRMNAKMTESLNGIVQVDARGTKGSSGATLEWAYIAYEPADDWTLQLGRKRLPIYYYSDFMDVGFAYPWVRAPQDLYGWEVNNFNGVTVVKTGHMQSWNSRTSFFYGREDSRANVLANYFYPGMNVDLVWRDILGADLELSHDWLTVRFVYIESRVDISSPVAGPVVNGAKQHIYGVSANNDYSNWLLRSEFSVFDPWDDMGYRSNAGMLGVGYHVGDYTPMLTYSRFRDANSYGSPNWESDTTAITLRYDVNPTSAIKVQYDRFRELSSTNSTTGNANILSMSFDKTF